MTYRFVSDAACLTEQLARFVCFVHHKDGKQDYISFRDSSGFLGREEDYKSRIAEEARKELDFGNWKQSWIGTGKIAKRMKKAINKADNLVNKNQLIDFKNRLDSEHPKFCSNAEQVLFDIYRNPLCEESIAFDNAVKAFGAKYDTISFLFFIKDDTRFLPVRTSHIDKGFCILKIDFTSTRHCSWENYQILIRIIGEIRTVMAEFLPMRGIPRLIDAHSFVWIIQQNRFIDWNPNAEQISEIEQTVEAYLQHVVDGRDGRHRSYTSVYNRSAAVIRETRSRAGGICQYCNRPAPFIDINGKPYLEVHHVIWLSRGGKDSTKNTVALCPNCHKRMHVLDRPEDVKQLQILLNQYHY